ncbi:MAG: nicotinate phosphoribosyltransferase [Patescibacteria group bacterium]|jgi:nicotinate phosphoribosyltransferase
MTKPFPQTPYFTHSDLHLFELPQIFTAGSIWLESNMEHQVATFDLFVRSLPKNRNFLLMGGTEEIVRGILNWRYTGDEVRYLQKNNIITPRFARYLRGFHFTGDVYALPEGTVFFPDEPVVRITAPIIEGNLMTMFLINAFTSNTIFLSKVIRGVIAAKDKKFLASASLRAQSNESAFKFGRATYIAGGHGANMIPAFCRKYDLPFSDPSRKTYHALIKSFSTETAAMSRAAEIFPNTMDFMVDTYNFDRGLQHAIQVASELKRKKNSIKGITIDSGDLYKRSVQARKLLDKAGLKEVTITVASNLDEWKIDNLLSRSAPIDKFMALTEMIASKDAPSLEAVYKLAELQIGQTVVPKAKLASDKSNYPGKKQVFRVYQDGVMQKDIIGLEHEQLGRPLLRKMVEHGKLICRLLTLNEIRHYVLTQREELPSRLLSIKRNYAFPVGVSRQVNILMNKVRRAHM